MTLINRGTAGRVFSAAPIMGQLYSCNVHHSTAASPRSHLRMLIISHFCGKRQAREFPPLAPCETIP